MNLTEGKEFLMNHQIYSFGFNFKEFKKLLNEHNFKLVENTFSHDGETTSINKRFYFHEKETYQYFIKSKNSEIFLINNNGVFKKIDI